MLVAEGVKESNFADCFREQLHRDRDAALAAADHGDLKPLQDLIKAALQ